VLTLIWYLGLNFIVIYVLVYLNEREVTAHREVVELQGDLKELAVEERDRLAREIHDGLGASLSSLIIQSEYVAQLTKDDAVKKEVADLKQSAEEAIEELRLTEGRAERKPKQGNCQPAVRCLAGESVVQPGVQHLEASPRRQQQPAQTPCSWRRSESVAGENSHQKRGPRAGTARSDPRR
jgi:hypothetical protein